MRSQYEIFLVILVVILVMRHFKTFCFMVESLFVSTRGVKTFAAFASMIKTFLLDIVKTFNQGIYNLHMNSTVFLICGDGILVG